MNYGNPTEVLAVLRPAYYALLQGKMAQSVDVPQADGGSMRITYQASNINALALEISDLEEKERRQLSNHRPPRRCLVGG